MCEGCLWIFCLQSILGLKQVGKRRSGITLPLVLVSLFLVTARAEQDPAGEQVHKSMVENTFEAELSPLGSSMIAFVSWTPEPKGLALSTVFFHRLLRLRSLGMKI